MKKATVLLFFSLCLVTLLSSCNRQVIAQETDVDVLDNDYTAESASVNGEPESVAFDDSLDEDGEANETMTIRIVADDIRKASLTSTSDGVLLPYGDALFLYSNYFTDEGEALCDERLLLEFVAELESTTFYSTLSELKEKCSISESFNIGTTLYLEITNEVQTSILSFSLLADGRIVLTVRDNGTEFYSFHALSQELLEMAKAITGWRVVEPEILKDADRIEILDCATGAVTEVEAGALPFEEQFTAAKQADGSEIREKSFIVTFYCGAEEYQSIVSLYSNVIALEQQPYFLDQGLAEALTR
jgi:hypothetical protein